MKRKRKTETLKDLELRLEGVLQKIEDAESTGADTAELLLQKIEILNKAERLQKTQDISVSPAKQITNKMRDKEQFTHWFETTQKQRRPKGIKFRRTT